MKLYIIAVFYRGSVKHVAYWAYNSDAALAQATKDVARDMREAVCRVVGIRRAAK